MILAPAPTPTPSAVPSLAPSTVPTLAPVQPVDVVRDSMDLVTFWAGLTFGFVSVAVGAIAIFLALRANNEARKARAAVARERRRTFDLEILRDLLEAIENRNLLVEIGRRPTTIAQNFGGRLEMLPPQDLSSWRTLAECTRRELVDFLGEPIAEDAETLANINTGFYYATPTTIERLKKRLRDDVSEAVERRMTDRDD